MTRWKRRPTSTSSSSSAARTSRICMSATPPNPSPPRSRWRIPRSSRPLWCSFSPCPSLNCALLCSETAGAGTGSACRCAETCSFLCRCGALASAQLLAQLNACRAQAQTNKHDERESDSGAGVPLHASSLELALAPHSRAYDKSQAM